MDNELFSTNRKLKGDTSNKLPQFSLKMRIVAEEICITDCISNHNLNFQYNGNAEINTRTFELGKIGCDVKSNRLCRRRPIERFELTFEQVYGK